MVKTIAIEKTKKKKKRKTLVRISHRYNFTFVPGFQREYKMRNPNIRIYKSFQTQPNQFFWLSKHLPY